MFIGCCNDLVQAKLRFAVVIMNNFAFQKGDIP